ncbi:MAG: AmmeMemoRadiSam system protein B [Myxococcota bacterium]
MRPSIWLTALLLCTGACSAADGNTAEADDGNDDTFVQPGLDDPSARMWEKAGGWYPEDRNELDAEIEALIAAVDDPGEPRRAAAVIPPHASLKFSGPTVAELFARLEIPETVLILAPDHWGDDTPQSIWTEGPWLVPGHAIEIDYDLMGTVSEALPELESSRIAFAQHESEMMLPWLQYARPDVKIVVVAIFDNSKNDFKDFPVEKIEEYGAAVAEIVMAEEAAGREVLIMATTDLVHHETKEDSEVQDAQLMEHITALDLQGLYDYVTGESITICGEIVTGIAMSAVTQLGYDSMDLVSLGNSLHANDDETDVIGYPAAAAWKD